MASIDESAIEERFNKFRDDATKFSREIQSIVISNLETTSEVTAKINLFLAKTLFSKWAIEILAVLYSLKSASYGDVKKGTKGITSRVLSQKLKTLESAKLIHREVMNTRPPSVRCALTDKGLTVAKIAEPVFLYAAITEGLFSRPELLVQKHSGSTRPTLA